MNQLQMFPILFSLYSRYRYMGRKFQIVFLGLCAHHLARGTWIPQGKVLPRLQGVGSDSRNWPFLGHNKLCSQSPLRLGGDLVTKFWVMEWGKSYVCPYQIWSIKTPAKSSVLSLCLPPSGRMWKGQCRGTQRPRGMSNTPQGRSWVFTSPQEGRPLNNALDLTWVRNRSWSC